MPQQASETTLISEWLIGCGRPAVWLSLEVGDNDPTRFLAYLLAALQTVEANIGEGVLGVLQSPQPPPPIESVLTSLLNEVATFEDHFVLDLHDYRVIDATAVDHALTFLLEHLPPQVHLLIATREDPNLPLAWLRVRGQLTELRAADLRFTPSKPPNSQGGNRKIFASSVLAGESLTPYSQKEDGPRREQRHPPCFRATDSMQDAATSNLEEAFA